MGILSTLFRSVDELTALGYPREVAERIVSGELPMDQASRMARAQAQGFNPSQVSYHGTDADFSEFIESPYGSLGPGVYLTPDSSLASEYANSFATSDITSGAQVMPLLVRGESIPFKEFERQNPTAALSDLDEVQANYRRSGITSTVDKVNQVAGRDPQEVKAVFDPRDIRSYLSAAFDPEYKGANILGSAAGTAAALGLLAAPRDAEAKTPEFLESLPQLQPYEPGLIETAVQNVAEYLKDIGITESNYTANQMASSLSNIADYIPFIGDAKGFAETSDFIDEGKYGQAAIAGLLSSIGLIPGVGDLAVAGIKGIAGIPARVMTPNVEKALEKTPELEGLLPYVTEAEAARITPRTAEKTVAAFKAVKPDELRGAAVEGAPKLGWYQASSEAINSIFEGDAQRFSALLAALSPQTSVENNLINTVNTFANWEKAGRPQDPNEILEIMGRSVQGNKGVDSVLGAWRGNAIRALTAPPNPETGLIELSGPKVFEFSQAIQGDLNRFTNDAWQANITGIPQSEFAASGGNILPGYSPGYIGASARGRQVAEDMSLRLGVDIMPSEVQETGWSFGKALYEQTTEMRKADPTMTAKRIVQEGLLDPQRIADVPDFASLFAMPEYGKPLREIGYGSLIDEAARTSSGFGNRDLSAAASPEGALNVARRLDQLRGYRNFVSDSKPFRPRFTATGQAGGRRQGLQQPYGKPSGKSVSLDFGASGRQVAPTPEYAKATGVDTVVYQLNKTPKDRAAFVEKMRQAQSSRGAVGKSVDVYDPKDYQGYKLFSTQDGAGGFAISPSGELSSVVSLKGSGLKGFSDSAISAGVANGARWLNAFDTVLPNKYGRFGFKPVARLKFDENFARSDWGDKAVDEFMKETSAFNDGKPDLVFMVYDPSFEGVVGNNVGGQLVDDYDKAVDLVEREIEKLSKKER